MRPPQKRRTPALGGGSFQLLAGERTETSYNDRESRAMLPPPPILAQHWFRPGEVTHA
jgi:hypothetical protein